MNKLIQRIYFDLVIFIFISEFNFSQELVPAYNDQYPNPFAGYSQPVEIAILHFDGNNNIEDKLFNALKRDSKVKNNFLLISNDALEQQKNALGLKTLDAKSSEV